MSQRIRRLLVLGGGSEIAGAFVERCIEADLDHLVLAGRAGGSLDDAAGRLLRDHPDVRIEMAGFDAEASDRHHAALRALHDHHGPFDTVLVAFGRLGAYEDSGGVLDVDVSPAAYRRAQSASTPSARRRRGLRPAPMSR